MKDNGKKDHEVKIVPRASKANAFVYNHIYLLTWLRKRSCWKETMCSRAIRFSTVFITLKTIYDHKHDLQALVTDKHTQVIGYLKVQLVKLLLLLFWTPNSGKNAYLW